MNRTASLLVAGALIGAVLATAVITGVAALRPAYSSDKYAAGDAGRPVRARVLRAGHGLPVSHPLHGGMQHLAERLAAVSGGALKLEIYPNEQLGNETQVLEQVQAGTLAITQVNAAPLGNFVRRMAVFGLPYVFRDTDHFWRFTDGPDGLALLDALALADSGRATGLRGLAYYDGGSRNFYSKEPILSPDDLRGKKLRVQNDPVAMDMVQALGAAPTPISYGELYTALRQGVVDGAENNAPSFVTSRHLEVCSHFTLDHHTRIPNVLLISDTVWADLSTQEQAWLREAAADSSRFQRKLWEEETVRAFDAMRAAGVTIHEVDLEPFRALTAPILEQAANDPALAPTLRRIVETP